MADGTAARAERSNRDLARLVRLLERAARFVDSRSFNVLDDCTDVEVEAVLAIAGAAARGVLL